MVAVLATTCLALVFIVAKIEKSCPVYGNCAVPWNIKDTTKQSCCKGVATAHGCRSGQGTTITCWCDSYIGDACSAHRSHKCPEIKKVKSERNLNVENGKSLVSQMKNQVDTAGMNMNYFFNQFFMQVYQQAYQLDTANLIAFNALMSETNPPAPQSPMKFLFSIFKLLILELPDVGVLIDITLSVTGDIISLATNANGNHYQQEIAWKQFLQAKALSYSQVEERLHIGLWAWTQAWWKKNNFPGLVKGSSSQHFQVFAKLINKLWSEAKTQQESYISFIASYFNSVGAGFMVKCQSGTRNGLEWGITQIPNSVPLMQNLMQLTDNCIDPTTNFKDFNGHPVAMGVIGEVCQQGPSRMHCSSGVIPSTAPLAITSQFTQTRDSASISPSLCYHSKSRKFPITFTGTKNNRDTADSVVESGGKANALTLPLALGGTALGIVVLAVVVVVVVVLRLRKGMGYTVDEESKLAVESDTGDYETETGDP